MTDLFRLLAGVGLLIFIIIVARWWYRAEGNW